MAALGLVLGVAATLPAAGQQRADHLGRELTGRPDVTAALDALRVDEPRLIEDQIAICEIPAPPFKEQARAERYRDLFREIGLVNVRIDREGNVLGERPGRAPRPHVVVSAHLDTVFTEGTDVRVKRDGSVLRGPGIADDCRGLAVVLGVARAIVRLDLETPGTITFVGTVGEEGLGDLRGVKHLFAEELKGRVDRFVSVDGTGHGITHVGVGSRRYRVTFTGPGGHSFGAFGLANPVHALGRAIARVADFDVPTQPKTTFNVGRVGGGTSVNAIAYDAWMEVDMRSADAAALKALDARFLDAVDAALADENARWDSRGRLSVDPAVVGDRPAGSTPATSPIVRAALAVSQALGLQAGLGEGSTDANAPMALGIPAITIGGGGSATGVHSLAEAFETTNSWLGTQRALLVTLALAEP
ncbi:MAG: M20/M25/M40 family metallo-hydrolase [Acidobacteria bacterium]|nr:M20/M25/M40 family metallo-hydrolase [Acidobacteriota bacterium]